MLHAKPDRHFCCGGVSRVDRQKGRIFWISSGCRKSQIVYTLGVQSGWVTLHAETRVSGCVHFRLNPVFVRKRYMQKRPGCPFFPGMFGEAVFTQTQ